MKKRYYFLFLISFFAFLPLAQAGASVPATATPAFAVEADAEMSRAEKRALRKELRQATREARKLNRDDSDVLAIICAIIIPPLGVYLHQDSITIDFWVALVLMVLTVTWFLASLFALLVVLDVFSLEK
ncbi:MAG: YqaE/Pmp3 family membrane protein [Bacteroidota bacterium]